MHPGGPFWSGRDEGAWSIPKGEIEPGETALQVAIREFREELGQEPPEIRRRPQTNLLADGGQGVDLPVPVPGVVAGPALALLRRTAVDGWERCV